VVKEGSGVAYKVRRETSFSHQILERKERMNKIILPSTQYLTQNGISFKIIYLQEVPKTALDIERLYGCSIKQVLKTLVFVTENIPLIVVIQGHKKVDPDKLKQHAGVSTLRLANADEVFTIKGYVIGAVSPFGIKNNVQKIIDSDVFTEKSVNIGAGTTATGIELTTSDLNQVWDGIIAAVSVD
jgi:Cys-tRNA(Pro) deacylase